jgi:type II secretory pathway predicted ATPase ExeA
LARHLPMQQHAPLAMRIVHDIHLETLDREAFSAMIDHAIKVAGARQNLLAISARELLFRSTPGLPRVATYLLDRALQEAHEPISTSSTITRRNLAEALVRKTFSPR